MSRLLGLQHIPRSRGKQFAYLKTQLRVQGEDRAIDGT